MPIAAPAPPTNYVYRLGPGDVLGFRLADGFENPNVAAYFGATGQPLAIRVEADGTATFPYAGKLPVQGKNLGEVRGTLARALDRYFKAPRFDLQIQEYHGSQITVSGAVVKPGVQYLGDEPLTITRAIASAGGLTPVADLDGITLIHADHMRESINGLALLYRGDATQERVLAAGDTLLLGENHRNRVFLMGDELKTGALTIKAGKLSLTEALNDSQGPNNESQGPNTISATIGDIYVIRNAVIDGPNGAPTVTTLQNSIVIYRLDSSIPTSYVLADRFPLKPRDVIFVSAAPVTEWHRFISQLLPANLSTSVTRSAN
jgi:polysaccharide export outer membrane protein